MSLASLLLKLETARERNSPLGIVYDISLLKNLCSGVPIDVDISDFDGSEVAVKLLDNHDGTFTATYQPGMLNLCKWGLCTQLNPEFIQWTLS